MTEWERMEHKIQKQLRYLSKNYVRLGTKTKTKKTVYHLSPVIMRQYTLQ